VYANLDEIGDVAINAGDLPSRGTGNGAEYAFIEEKQLIDYTEDDMNEANNETVLDLDKKIILRALKASWKNIKPF
jgi:hypothetical protein